MTLLLQKQKLEIIVILIPNYMTSVINMNGDWFVGQKLKETESES